MIGDIVDGREKSNIVLLKDTVLYSGRPAVACIITSLCKRVERVHVICFDREPAYLQQLLPPDILGTRLEMHDFSKDILGWLNTGDPNVDTDLVQYLENCVGRHANHNVAIVIDCLSPLLLHRPAPYTCQTLHRLSSAKVKGADVEQVVSLVHGDLHDNHCLCLVEHMATTVLDLQPSVLPQFMAFCNTLHKRSSGKVMRTSEHFNISKNCTITDVTEVKHGGQGALAAQGDSQLDPTANLTFNLSLTDSEKTARSQVKLPYTYDKDRQDSTLNKSVGEGKIFYQPDEADDFDEEDPDDDLDI